MSAKRRAAKGPSGPRATARPPEAAGPARPDASDRPSGATVWPAWIAPLVLAVVFAALTLWTWATWTDPIVDFGRELYVPWRITAGDRLYRDLAYFNGPLSPYLNATLFRLFGVSLRTLVWANLVVLATTVALSWALLRRITNAFAATVGCVAFLACCGFGQQAYVANYNWITPYSHEATHGVALGLASLLALSRWRDRGEGRWLAAGGAALGLAFLTKPEVFLATAVAHLVAVGLQVRRSGALVRVGAVWMSSAVAPILCVLLLLAVQIGLGGAANGLLAPYAATLRADIVGNPFYLSVSGLNDPSGNALRMMRYVLVALGLAVPAAVIARLGGRWPPWLAAASALVATATLALLLVPLRMWTDAGRVLPVALAGIGLTALPFVSSRGADSKDATLTLSAFALALLAKILLNPSMEHYGFALAGPGLALTAAMLVGPLPAWVDEHRWSGAAVRACVLTLLAGPVITFLIGTQFFIASKPVALGEGSDRFYANERGRVVESTLRWLRERADAAAASGASPPTVAVMPEGVMLNYLARLPNPTPYFTTMPIETTLFGEGAMLRAFEARPPDVVLIVHADTREYGVRYFGIDYGRDLASWIGGHYRSSQMFGDPPLQDGSAFGIAVMERVEPATPARPDGPGQ